MTVTLQFADMTSSSNFCDLFTYGSEFHVNIITGSGVMIIFIYKELTRNPEIRNTLVSVCPIYGDWAKSGIPNLAQMSLMKCY